MEAKHRRRGIARSTLTENAASLDIQNAAGDSEIAKLVFCSHALPRAFQRNYLVLTRGNLLKYENRFQTATQNLKAIYALSLFIPHLYASGRNRKFIQIGTKTNNPFLSC